MNNLYELEPLLLAHIRAQCSLVHLVAGVPDAAAVRMNAQYVNERPYPVAGANGLGTAKFGAVFVCPALDFNDIENVGETSEGNCSITHQRWLVLVATKNQRRMNEAGNDLPSASRQDNGELAAQVITAMHGFTWSPAGWPTLRVLRLNRAPTGLPANVYPDENGLYVTALAYTTEQPS